MRTGKNKQNYYKHNNIINTIMYNKLRYIIVFILMCIFSCVYGLFSVAYADTESNNKSKTSRYVTLEQLKIEEDKIGNMDVKTSCSLNGYGKLYSFTEVNVEFKNSGDFFAGIIQIGIPQSEEGVLYTKDFEVATSSSKIVTMYMPINVQTSYLNLEILDRTGKSFLKKKIEVKIYNQDKTVVGVLADNPGQINYIAADTNSTYLYFNNITMPTDYRALDAINLLVINRYDISQLSVGQYVAITEWVRHGGTLVLGTGEGAVKYLGSFAKKYNISVAGVQELEISFVDRTKNDIEDLVRTKLIEHGYNIDDNIWNNFWTAYSAGNYENKSEGIVIEPVADNKKANMSVISAYVEFVKNYWATTNVAEINIENGITIESSAAVPIMQSIIDDKGKVIVASFDLAVNENNIGLKEQISSLILSYASVEDKSIYNTFLSSILGSAKGRIPNTIIYIGVLVIYVGLTLLTIIVLNKNNKTKNLFKAISFYTVIVCLLFAVMGIGTRINKLHSSYFTITELKEDKKAEVERYFNVTVPENKIYKLKMNKKREIYNINIVNRETSLVSSDNDSYNTYLTESNKSIDVRFDGISTFDTKTFSNNEIVETEDSMEVTLNCWDNEYGGAIINKTNKDLEYVFIITKTSVLYVGEMDKGEKVAESKFKRYNYTSLDELEYIIPKLMDKKASDLNSVDSKGNITPNGVTRVMQYYMMSSGLSSVNKGCVFAITKDVTDLFEDDNIKEEGINIITSEFDVNYTAGNQRFIPNICMSDITFELGNYNYSTTTGSIYVVNNTIGNYNIGTDKKLQSLSFLASSKEKKKNSRNFEGKVCFWNYSTNTYDVVFESNSDKTITDFGNYVGGNNIIKIKFEVKSDKIGYNVPIITAVVTN